jgi:hypothetical protein
MSKQSFVLVYYVYSVSTDNILMWIYEVYFIFIMEHDLVYENFEVFFPFPNLHVEDVHIDQFSKILLRAKI